MTAFTKRRLYVKWDFLQFRHHRHLRQTQFRKAPLCLGCHLNVHPKLRTVKHKQLVDVRESVHRDIITKVTNKMQLYRLVYYS